MTDIKSPIPRPTGNNMDNIVCSCHAEFVLLKHPQVVTRLRQNLLSEHTLPSCSLVTCYDQLTELFTGRMTDTRLSNLLYCIFLSCVCGLKTAMKMESSLLGME
jgi:hypothetical protein